MSRVPIIPIYVADFHRLIIEFFITFTANKNYFYSQKTTYNPCKTNILLFMVKLKIKSVASYYLPFILDTILCLPKFNAMAYTANFRKKRD